MNKLHNWDMLYNVFTNYYTVTVFWLPQIFALTAGESDGAVSPMPFIATQRESCQFNIESG